MEIQHISENRYFVPVKNEYYAIVDIDSGVIEDADDVSEETLDEIYDAAQTFHIERLRSEAEEPDGYKKFGLSPEEFIGI